ncbi:acetylglutamate kinase [Microbacterium sp. EYE_5]|uniref:acetylglutamate kinase n=1 Tax=unclassified Microbacterium TaxID=2609290 RepID=UPI0020051F5B|nr:MULTISPECIES: acetylglutamate kinase [unclassified Microbacterium]MCK6081895.1 acetylglutamate kinase [Microbacterium sp. EYE_382]MCK6087165.1 acetylglutamate kinase [Microbacterium sp. EYE_384]MCK6124857.1 acetylglutamate kinase [Microbacterium sp. EYE_80]MCK6127928.1 acetylglutamate kinase [Microbacterium sp. EYE_79]MCK6142849.1 acetylglutamate kinase [Microbacterium sp. EYE_39]
MTDIQQTTPEEAAGKAAVLVESLPWLKRFRDQIVVIKYGGNAMVSEELQAAFAEDVAYLHHVGVKVVVVHGGGPQISKMLDRLDIPSEFKGGYRVTSTEAIGVVRMVLTGQINPQLVSRINAHGSFATGLSGEDAGLFRGRRRGVVVDGAEHDLGHVGDVVGVDPQTVLDHLSADRVPVVSSIAPDADAPGTSLNVNADAAAAALAVALGATKLVILTDVAGLYADWPNRDSLVSHLTATELRDMLPRLESGMIPKMQACLDAVEGGVDRAAIIDGRQPHSVLVELFTERGIGTEVVA